MDKLNELITEYGNTMYFCGAFNLHDLESYTEYKIIVDKSTKARQALIDYIRSEE